MWISKWLVAILVFCSITMVVLGVGTAYACDPNEHPYILRIIYGTDAASQSLSVYDPYRSIPKYEFNGYGKENTVFTTYVCLGSMLYTFVARDGFSCSCLLSTRLKPSWSEGSLFVVATMENLELLRGTCDSGSETEFSFYRFSLCMF